jgi:RNA polymerase sigma-70 factor, ECF subfamily
LARAKSITNFADSYWFEGPGSSASSAKPFLTTRTGIAATRAVFLENHPNTFDTTASGLTPEKNLLRLDNEAALHAALEQLKPSLREALLLCDLEEIRYKDITLILDVSVGTVM